MVKAATAVGTSYKSEMMGMAIKGAPAPVATFNTPPNKNPLTKAEAGHHQLPQLLRGERPIFETLSPNFTLLCDGSNIQIFADYVTIVKALNIQLHVVDSLNPGAVSAYEIYHILL